MRNLLISTSFALKTSSNYSYRATSNGYQIQNGQSSVENRRRTTNFSSMTHYLSPVCLCASRNKDRSAISSSGTSRLIFIVFFVSSTTNRKPFSQVLASSS